MASELARGDQRGDRAVTETVDITAPAQRSEQSSDDEIQSLGRFVADFGLFDRQLMSRHVRCPLRAVQATIRPSVMFRFFRVSDHLYVMKRGVDVSVRRHR